MWKEFLEDYQESEQQFRKDFEQELLQSKPSILPTYPPLDRFHKLSRPYAQAWYGASIWPQIPLYASLIIPIAPRSKREFERFHGFAVSDIPRLLDLCKDTGRVQFALYADPISYNDLDFLEPIFVELKPPQLGAPWSTSINVDEAEYDRAIVEFDTLAAIEFYPAMESMMRDEGMSDSHVQARFRDFASVYAFLKVKGYDALLPDLQESIVDSPLFARVLLDIFHKFIVIPQVDLLKPMQNFGMDYLSLALEVSRRYGLETPKRVVPCEIGTFLMRQLTFLPEGFEACREIMHHYDHRDLYKIMNAVDEGARAKSVTTVQAKSAELYEVFNLVWQDAAGTNKQVQAARFLIPLCIGAVGMIASPSAGLLATLGFYLAERLSDQMGDSMSERLVKSLIPGYAVTLYDFRKKYGLDRREHE